MCIPEGIVTKIEEGKTMQRLKEKGQKDNYLQNTTQTRFSYMNCTKNRCFGRVPSSYFTSGTQFILCYVCIWYI